MVGKPRYWLWLASVYGQLGRHEQAGAALDKVRELDPGLAAEPREAIEKDIHVEDWVEHMLDGLRKAGLDIPAKSS